MRSVLKLGLLLLFFFSVRLKVFTDCVLDKTCTIKKMYNGCDCYDVVFVYHFCDLLLIGGKRNAVD